MTGIPPPTPTQQNGLRVTLLVLVAELQACPSLVLATVYLAWSLYNIHYYSLDFLNNGSKITKNEYIYIHTHGLFVIN